MIVELFSLEPVVETGLACHHCRDLERGIRRENLELLGQRPHTNATAADTQYCGVMT